MICCISDDSYIGSKITIGLKSYGSVIRTFESDSPDSEMAPVGTAICISVPHRLHTRKLETTFYCIGVALKKGQNRCSSKYVAFCYKLRY